MADPFMLDAATARALGAVPFERTPVYSSLSSADLDRYPWRPWHLERYGGSPIPLCFNGVLSHTRLYLGPSQAELGNVTRPLVEGIVNLCELDDPWPLTDVDRRWPRGEGVSGYTWQMLDRDSRDVATLIRAGQRILIHCMAGVNRSPALTCAVLMQVEGICAEDALRRVQRFHAYARPEDRHWQVLRQLAIVLRARV